MKRILLVFNCLDRTPKHDKIVDALKKKFPEYSVEFSLPASIPKLIDDVTNAKNNKYSAVAAGGGDGTMGLVASILAGTDMPLMAVPMGTVNAFSKSLGISVNPEEAVERYNVDRIKCIDTGSVNDRFFLCFMSIGIDALAVHLLNKTLKNIVGKSAYAVSGGMSLLKIKKLEPFEIEGKKLFHLVISNIVNYAGYNIYKGSDLSDGRMYYSVYGSRNIFSVLDWAGSLAHGKLTDFSEITCEKELTGVFSKPLCAQFDGEPVLLNPDNHTPSQLSIRIARNSLRIFY